MGWPGRWNSTGGLIYWIAVLAILMGLLSMLKDPPSVRGRGQGAHYLHWAGKHEEWARYCRRMETHARTSGRMQDAQTWQIQAAKHDALGQVLLRAGISH